MIVLQNNINLKFFKFNINCIVTGRSKMQVTFHESRLEVPALLTKNYYSQKFPLHLKQHLCCLKEWLLG